MRIWRVVGLDIIGPISDTCVLIITINIYTYSKSTHVMSLIGSIAICFTKRSIPIRDCVSGNSGHSTHVRAAASRSQPNLQSFFFLSNFRNVLPFSQKCRSSQSFFSHKCRSSLFRRFYRTINCVNIALQ